MRVDEFTSSLYDEMEKELAEIKKNEIDFSL